MKITVRQYGDEILSANPTNFDSEEAVIKAFRLAKHPDEEFTAKIEDGERVKYCMLDGDDGLVILAVLCYRGLKDLVFSLNIADCINNDGKYWKLEKKRDKRHEECS